MGRYAREPDNAAKSCKARGSNLRVHFKVSFQLDLCQNNPSYVHNLQTHSPVIKHKFGPLSSMGTIHVLVTTLSITHVETVNNTKHDLLVIFLEHLWNCQCHQEDAFEARRRLLEERYWHERVRAIQAFQRWRRPLCTSQTVWHHTRTLAKEISWIPSPTPEECWK